MKDFTFLSILALIYVLVFIFTNVSRESFNNKQLCRQLYSHTFSYEACLNRTIDKNIKLIKPIDMEVE